MGLIFISYRREDSEHASDRIYDMLVERFGKSETFKDVDVIPLGPDFRQVLEDAIKQSDVLLAVIGDRWLEVKDSSGVRRLDNELDFVRIEIEVALRSGKTVIPLLVGRAPMPKPEDLVPSLQALAYRNGMPIRAGRDFRHDIDRLIKELESIRNTPKANPASTDSSEADMLEMWRQRRASIEHTQAEVQELVAQRQDYAGAVALFEAIPQRLRDENLFQSLRERRDRVAELDREVRQAVDAMELDSLRPKVEELFRIKPQRSDLPKLLDMLSRHEEARRCVEEDHDYAKAVSILEKLPEDLRDPKLYPHLASHQERISQLESEIEVLRQERRMPGLHEKVSVLLGILPHRTDLLQLNHALSTHQRARELFESEQDYTGVWTSWKVFRRTFEIPISIWSRSGVEIAWWSSKERSVKPSTPDDSSGCVQRSRSSRG